MTAATTGAKTAQEHSFALLARARICGLVCGVLFCLAALAVVDALQTLMRHDFNRLELIPGETVPVSGSMPQNAETYKDITFTLEGSPGVSFRPLESFKGFWFGGLMWRGELTAAPNAEAGQAVLTIIDRVPAKKVASATTGRNGSQAPTAGDTPRSLEAVTIPAPSGAAPDSVLVQNPMLIHSVRVYPDAAARLAEESSLILRYTRIPPFAVAAFFFVGAMLSCAVHWVLFGRAEKSLAGLGIFFIHGIKPDARGTVAVFAHTGRADFTPGDTADLLDAAGHTVSHGAIKEKNQHKGFALFLPTVAPPRYGNLLAVRNKEHVPPAA